MSTRKQYTPFASSRHRGAAPGNFLERFWGKVAIRESGCWNWTAAKRNARGYGVIASSVHGEEKLLLAHRVAYELTAAEEIPAGLAILHSCNNPSCVNPAHLRIGTAIENKWDAQIGGTVNVKPAPFARKLSNRLRRLGFAK